MAHAIWSGSISFGLVTIPVKLFTAVRANDLRFNFLHKKDDGRIYNERHCTVCGEKVEYADLVRGYEYEKGRYVTVTDEDLKRVNVEATQSVEIVEFVDLDQINPMYFDTPYYLEPEKKGRHAYALLRESLRSANKVGIAKVVIRSREHLAALKPNGEALVLELMHYADELVAQSDFDFPSLKEDVAPAEMKIAKLLIDTMSAEKFEPERFQDTYREEVLAMIDARAAGKSIPEAPAKKRGESNVVNLMDVLQRSLEAKGKPSATTSKAPAAKKKSANAAKPKKKSSAA
ncbi:MAG: Ku protein [Candidatus Velthaea sp.]|jgi:DNA end-binding protein Ku